MARLEGEGASHPGYCESVESHRDSPSASRSGVIIVGATAGTIGFAEGVVTTASLVNTPNELYLSSQQMLTVEHPLVVSQEQEEIRKMAAEEVEGNVSKEVFSSYSTPTHSIFSSARPHPADIVEAASLADVSLPQPTYDLAPCVVQCEKLSSLQLEGVLYACQRHLTLLPDGRRGAFFIGDGAGVGKGRQIAAIILENYVRGRCRHIWFSVSHDLKMDAERYVY
jgi:hypothetical protein